MSRLTICAIFKNEAAYLYEWLSFHSFLGVKKFFLYNNNSSDNSLEIIRSWPQSELVTVIDWPMIGGQNAAYADMLTRHRDEADWCAFIDCDEFLCPSNGLDLISAIELVDPPPSGLYVHWRMFGSSGHKEQLPGLVTERFTRRSHDSFGPNSIGKSIVRLAETTEVGFCHIVRTRGLLVNDSGDTIDQQGNGIHSRSSHRLIALNHYYTKSSEEWRYRREFGKADKAPNDPDFRRDMEDFYRHDQNEVEDYTAFRITQNMKPLFYSTGL